MHAALALLSTFFLISVAHADSSGKLGLNDFSRLLGDLKFPAQCKLTQNELKRGSLTLEIASPDAAQSMILFEAVDVQAIGSSLRPIYRVTTQIQDGSGSYGDVFHREFLEIQFDARNRVISAAILKTSGAGRGLRTESVSCR